MRDRPGNSGRVLRVVGFCVTSVLAAHACYPALAFCRHRLCLHVGMATALTLASVGFLSTVDWMYRPWSLVSGQVTRHQRQITVIEYSPDGRAVGTDPPGPGPGSVDRVVLV